MAVTKLQTESRKVKGQQHFRFEIRYDAPLNGTRRQRRKRLWLPDSSAAEAVERELRGEEPADRLTWSQAWEKFHAAHVEKRVQGHLDNMGRDVRSLCAFLGDLPVEQTPLGRFTDWLRWREGQASARTAQLARTHTLKIARWAASQGLVTGLLPFEKAPVPESTPHRRSAATPEGFLGTLEVLPESMSNLWLAVGLTGARISGMAGLLEADVAETHLTVTTKGSKRVSYPLLPPLRQAVENARSWKRKMGLASAYVFLTRRGTPWDHRTFDNRLARIQRDHPEIPKTTPHQLRHMWATIAAAANFSPDYLQAGLGHDDRRSAEQYVHHTQGMADTVAATVMAALTELIKPVPQLAAPPQRVDTA